VSDEGRGKRVERRGGKAKGVLFLLWFPRDARIARAALGLEVGPRPPHHGDTIANFG
jgi:hypothetical protein